MHSTRNLQLGNSQDLEPSIILLTQQNVKLPSRWLSLNPYISAALSFHQESLLLHWMAVKTETHNWTNCRESMIAQCLALNRTSVSHLPPQGSGSITEYYKTEVVEACCKLVSFGHVRTIALMSSQLWLPAQDQAIQNSSMDEEGLTRSFLQLRSSCKLMASREGGK